jgi:hypothetical protein
MGYYTITKADVGKRHIQAFGKTWLTSGFLGIVLDMDVGKRVYQRRDILQVENQAQLRARIEAAPRPWKAEFDDIGNGSCHWQIIGGDGNPVAVSPVGPHAFNEKIAQLIAAAPALLEGLRFTLEAIGRLVPPDALEGDEPFEIAAYMDSLASARAAIAKAEPDA